jgi:hypothetical protein
MCGSGGGFPSFQRNFPERNSRQHPRRIAVATENPQDYGSGLKISVDLKVDNPAKQRVTVKIPSIRLYYRGKMVASTAVSDKTYTIEPVSTGKISGIMIEASYLNLLSTAPSIITDFLTQGTAITNNLGFDVIAEVNGIPLKVQKL